MRNKEKKVHVGPVNIGVVCEGDGHTRITRGENILVVGGCQESHEKSREVAIRINEALDRKGREVSKLEMRDIMKEATER